MRKIWYFTTGSWTLSGMDHIICSLAQCLVSKVGFHSANYADYDMHGIKVTGYNKLIVFPSAPNTSHQNVKVARHKCRTMDTQGSLVATPLKKVVRMWEFIRK